MKSRSCTQSRSLLGAKNKTRNKSLSLVACRCTGNEPTLIPFFSLGRIEVRIREDGEHRANIDNNNNSKIIIIIIILITIIIKSSRNTTKKKNRRHKSNHKRRVCLPYRLSLDFEYSTQFSNRGLLVSRIRISYCDHRPLSQLNDIGSAARFCFDFFKDTYTHGPD